ncbi:MAG TPA: hypothetical protein V6D33_09925 [Cyanophyceae cyanobacterium]
MRFVVKRSLNLVDPFFDSRSPNGRSNQCRNFQIYFFLNYLPKDSCILLDGNWDISVNRLMTASG